MRVSNTQRSLYLQCGKKYYYRYKKKMRARDKGSALYFGTAFDQASDILFHERDLQSAKDKFTDLWLSHEENLSCKFSKTDMDLKILEKSDWSKIEASAANLNSSKAVKEYQSKGDISKLVKEIKKMKDNGYTRDLTLEEEKFIHYVTVLSMMRKGYLMLESFYDNILPHITEVISTQLKVDVNNGHGDSIIGYIDLVCKMAGYKLPSGRVLTDEDIIVADVKTAGITYWNKLDDLDNSDQLDLYLVSPQVQELAETNLISYMAVAKQISKDEKSFCKSCGHEKTTRHSTCNNEIEDQRCGGEWDENIKYFCAAKIVINERNIQEAQKVYDDYDAVVRGIKAEVFPRNREQCYAYGSVCEFKHLCGKCLSPDQEEEAVDKWKKEYGEKS